MRIRYIPYIPLYIRLYTTIGAIVFPYIWVKNKQVLKPVYIPPLFTLWPLALPLSYTEDLEGIIKELRD